MMESFSTELFVWCAYGTCLASSFSSVEQIGHSDVVIDEVLVLEEVYCEWHAGVFRADNPADRAMWSSGRGGSESSS